MKLALVIGHCPSAPGASNETTGMTEFHFNDGLARDIARTLDCGDVTVELIYRDEPNDYSGLPAKVNGHFPDFIVSLHANAYEEKEGEPEATGTEMLYWHSSRNGLRLATILQRHVVDALGLKERSLKPRNSSKQRGGPLLKRTYAPCVIAEPFFIDNDHDLGRAMRCRDDLVRAYATAIQKYSELV